MGCCRTWIHCITMMPTTLQNGTPTRLIHTFIEHSVSCFKNLPPCSASSSIFRPSCASQGASHLPVLLCKQWALLHYSWTNCHHCKNSETLSKTLFLGFASGFFNLYLPFSYFPTFRKKKLLTNMPFFMIIFCWFNSSHSLFILFINKH